MNPPRFHLDALEELEQQALFYEERSPGLGERFVSEVDLALALAVSMPGVGSPYKYGPGVSFQRTSRTP